MVLESQLNESQLILDQLEVSLDGIAIQKFLSVLTACDLNQGNTFQEDEVDKMIHSLESIERIQINKSLLKNKIVERGRNVYSIVELIRDILEEKEDRKKPVDEQIFTFCESQ